MCKKNKNNKIDNELSFILLICITWLLMMVWVKKWVDNHFDKILNNNDVYVEKINHVCEIWMTIYECENKMKENK